MRCVLIVMSVGLALSVTEPTLAQTVNARGQVIADTIPAPSLAGNLLGDEARQPVFVYLPPGYETKGDRRYATIYLLHGVLDSPDVWVEPIYQGMTIQAVMDELIAAGEVRPMIVVMVNGANAYGASLYMNSPVTGNWRDYVVNDVVAHVDETYRTLASPASRALVGHSMGGFGAINLAMRHPDVFSVAWGMNPCCLCCIGDEMPREHPVWRILDTLDGPDAMWRHLEEHDDPWPLLAAGAATVLAPAPERPPRYFEPSFQIDGDTIRATGAAARMEEKLPLANAAMLVENLRSLRGLAMDVAFSDQFVHIPPATIAFSDTLTALAVPHVFEAYDGDHRNRMSERLPGLVLPWVSRLLDHGSAEPLR
jgi:S-formylglutathione hydrolase